MENLFELLLNILTAIENTLDELLMERLDKMKLAGPYPEFLNITDASRYLIIAKQTLYGLTASRNIPHFKRGKLLYLKSMN